MNAEVTFGFICPFLYAFSFHLLLTFTSFAFCLILSAKRGSHLYVDHCIIVYHIFSPALHGRLTVAWNCRVAIWKRVDICCAYCTLNMYRWFLEAIMELQLCIHSGLYYYYNLKKWKQLFWKLYLCLSFLFYRMTSCSDIMTKDHAKTSWAIPVRP